MDGIFDAFTWGCVVTMAVVAVGSILLSYRDDRGRGHHGS
jgi:hypothetical protein